jgi:N-acetylneuraminic acid mutarotase
MYTNRTQHTATRLQTGDVLVVGGYNNLYGGSPTLAYAELFHPATNTWTNAGHMAVPRAGHTATLLPSGKVLVVGGGLDNGTTTTAELYDPATNSWSPAASLIHKRSGFNAVLLKSGKVLVAGGVVQSQTVSAAELYDPASNTWLPAGTLLTGRMGASATLLGNGEVLLAGGQTVQSGPPQNTANAELYDPVYNTWRAMPPMPFPRSGHTATLLPNGLVLLTGGDCAPSSGALDSSTLLFDWRLGTWIRSADLSLARLNHTAVLLGNGDVMVAGGMNPVTTLSIAGVEIYHQIAQLQVIKSVFLPEVRR